MPGPSRLYDGGTTGRCREPGWDHNKASLPFSLGSCGAASGKRLCAARLAAGRSGKGKPGRPKPTTYRVRPFEGHTTNSVLFGGWKSSGFSLQRLVFGLGWFGKRNRTGIDRDRMVMAIAVNDPQFPACRGRCARLLPTGTSEPGGEGLLLQVTGFVDLYRVK